jgi:hypothetical protein
MTISAWDLRQANLKRLPVFKNKNGEPAHSSADGSDWSLAQWFQATAGEIGEFLEAFWNGSDKEKAHELADVQIYLDLLDYRLSAELSVGDRYVGLQGMVYCCLGMDRHLTGWGAF